MVIEIPGEITFSRTYNIPPIQVELPLTAHARTLGQGAATAVILCCALPIAALFLSFIVFFAKSAVQAEPTSSVIILPMLGFLAMAFVPKAISGILDIARSGPTLIFDPHGLTDRRAGKNIPWADIVSARVDLARNGTGVQLILRTPIEPRPLFDRGSNGFFGWRNADEYRVSVNDLSVRTHVLTQTALALVRLNGGTVER